jgi:hypothetical protein
LGTQWLESKSSDLGTQLATGLESKSSDLGTQLATGLESKSSDLGTQLSTAANHVPKSEDLDSSHVPKDT